MIIKKKRTGSMHTPFKIPLHTHVWVCVYTHITKQQKMKKFSLFNWMSKLEGTVIAHLHLDTNGVNELCMFFRRLRSRMSFIPFILQSSKKSRTLIFLLILKRIYFKPNKITKEKKEWERTPFRSYQIKSQKIMIDEMKE